MQQDEDKIIHLRDGLTWREKQTAVEMARLTGFQSTSVTFPVVSREHGREIPVSLSELKGWQEAVHTDIPEGYTSAADYAKPVEDFDWRQRKGLETLFGTGHILKDRNHDFLPDDMDVHLVLPEDSGYDFLASACTLAFRLGMETTAFRGLLAVEEEVPGNLIVFRQDKECSLKMEDRPDGIRIVVSGEGEKLQQFVEDICGRFPMQGAFDTWADRLMEITDSLAMQNLDGQLAYAKAYAEAGDCMYVSPGIEGRRDKIQKHFQDISFVNYKDMEEVYVKEYDLPWEKDTFTGILEEKVYPVLKAGDQVEICGALSEDPRIRQALSCEIEGRLESLGAEVQKVSVLCAYKQGYSWMEEKVLPELKDPGQISRIEIAFRPFLPDGVTDWKDEDGATPSYNNVGEDPDKWYDLPIRYLQELYPVEDLIASRTGIGREQISFRAYDGEEEITYQCRCFAKNGQMLYEDTYLAACSERPYLNDYPKLGKVHPSTGYIRVYLNGSELLSERVETDVEHIWEIYQSEVLPDCRAFMEEKMQGGISVKAQPFFSRLQIEVTVSEPDYRPGSREDLFSTLDGLHEDIYFAGADYFKNYGLERAGEMLDAPGLILPVIKKGSGRPHMKVTLSDQRASGPLLQRKHDCISLEKDRHARKVWMEQLKDTEDGRTAVVRTEGAEEKVLAAYAELMKESLLEITGRLAGIDVLELKSPQSSYKIQVKQTRPGEQRMDIRDIDLSEQELIGYDKYIEIISQLKKVPGLAVYRTAVSYMGREIYAVEMLPREEGYVSRTKRLTQYPSEIINCRHHANEVSSTNAAFMLIQTLLTEDAYKDIVNRLNLVIVPMENVDGAAIHYELQKDHPYWKLHVARFNAIGKEFYHEHFKPDTIHTEAMGLTRLYGKFLPDIIVDNHGVPSHEWEQQFSGYTSPSYKGFWLPRSLLYGYFWTVTGEEYRSNYAVNKKMEDVIADSIGEDKEIAAWNQEWAERFEKFAHGWMPKLFPANYYKDMINYWIPFAYDPAHRYPSVRFPWVTAAAYTSEVADETAQGEYLYLCARAHLVHDLATLRMLDGCRCVYKDKWEISEYHIEMAHIRQRPVVV